MPSSITYTPEFLREVKRIAKKHHSLKRDLMALEEELLSNPRSGTRIGENVYKIRFAIKSKNRRKSGGGRVITFVFEAHTPANHTNIILLNIYDKGEQKSISDKDISKSVYVCL